jgi:hypothetical protein
LSAPLQDEGGILQLNAKAPRLFVKPKH